MTEEALKLALEALENIKNDPFKFDVKNDIDNAITAIKEALTNEALEKMAENARELGLDYEPEQPKVRTGNCLRVGVCASEGHKIAPQRTWVGLTLDERIELAQDVDWAIGAYCEYAEKIEAKLKAKNVL